MFSLPSYRKAAIHRVCSGADLALCGYRFCTGNDSRPLSLPVVVPVGGVSLESAVVTVNTTQATVQGVVTPEQMQLPTNGRNFLDLAQLEPG